MNSYDAPRSTTHPTLLCLSQAGLRSATAHGIQIHADLPVSRDSRQKNLRLHHKQYREFPSLTTMARESATYYESVDLLQECFNNARSTIPYFKESRIALCLLAISGFKILVLVHVLVTWSMSQVLPLAHIDHHSVYMQHPCFLDGCSA